MKSLFERLRSRRLASTFVLLATLSAAIVAGSFAAHGVRGQEKQNDSADATPLKVVNSSVPPNEFVKIARQVGPAVVNINTRTLPKQAENKGRRNFRGRVQPNPQNPGDDDQGQDQQQGQDNFQDFFNRFFGGQVPGFNGQIPMPFGGDESGGVRESLGSGFIVDPKGYIITNYHVVEKADKIFVKLSTDPDNQDDGRPARVIGTDKATDLAVIKIDTNTPLPTVKMGNSDNAQVGDWVEAIGSPFALSQTVTAGIISAKNRTIEPGAGGEFQHFIQTDAAINPGNSGGALVDVEGRLIGINTAIFSRSGGNQGIGFAIPSGLARNVMDSLISYGRVARGYLGVMIQDVTPALAKEFKLKDTGGALIGDVVPRGPADKAGLKDGDVVLEFNGKSVADSRQLKLTVADTKPGSTVPVKVWRDGSPRTLEVTVKDLPGTEQLAQNNTDNNRDTGTLKGVTVGDLDPQTRQQFNLPDAVKGALITEVKPDSASAEAGLKPGEVIEEINRHSVKSAEEAVRLTENAKDKQTLVRVWENGGCHYVVVDETKQTG